MTNSNRDTAYVFCRSSDRARLVGRYRYERTANSRAYGEFAYVGSWLRSADAFPLDPVNLPLSRGPFVTTKRGCLHGALADATPDRWGREIAALRRPGHLFSSVDWLFATGPDRVGCLEFAATPDPPMRDDHPRLDLSSLGAIKDEFDRIEQGKPAHPEAERIYRAGASMGGARPKAVVEDGGHLWIAKFERRSDAYDQCAAEHAAMRLATDCGIETADTRLVELGSRKAVLVRRFDRTPGPEFAPSLHFLSALSLVDADETSATGSYTAIAAGLRRHGSRQREDRRQLFVRMVFNVLCGNRDDHLKNHAIVHGPGGWRLAPAFDIVPQPDMHPAQAIEIGTSGAFPSLANCLSRCGDFGLEEMEAIALIDDMAARVAEWRTCFVRDGVDEATIRHLAPAFSIAQTAMDDRTVSRPKP